MFISRGLISPLVIFVSLCGLLVGTLVEPTPALARFVGPGGESVAEIESPENGPVSGLGVTRGWAFAFQPGVSSGSVELFVDGQSIGQAPCCSERADVQAAFPYGLLSPGLHTIGIQFGVFDGIVSSLNHPVIVVKPGGFEFLGQFDLSNATAQVVTVHPWALAEHEEIRLEGVKIRDKASQQEKVITVHLRWFVSSQTLGFSR